MGEYYNSSQLLRKENTESIIPNNRPTLINTLRNATNIIDFLKRLCSHSFGKRMNSPDYYQVYPSQVPLDFGKYSPEKYYKFTSDRIDETQNENIEQTDHSTNSCKL